VTLNATEHSQITELAAEIADSAKLPGSLSEVMAAGLEATRPDPSAYSEMVAEAEEDLAGPASWPEALGGVYPEDVDDADWR
jgi:hypothetical protein